MALILSNKIAIVPENIFSKCFNDRLVSKGTMLEVMTMFFQEYIAIDGIGVDDLVSVLTRAKVAHRMLEFMPQLQRSYEEFDKHFEAAGLHGLVEWNTKEIKNVKASGACGSDAVFKG